MLFLQTRNETEDRLRDCASWLPLAAGASSRKLASRFFLKSALGGTPPLFMPGTLFGAPYSLWNKITRFLV